LINQRQQPDFPADDFARLEPLALFEENVRIEINIEKLVIKIADLTTELFIATSS